MQMFLKQLQEVFPYDIYHIDCSFGKPEEEWENLDKPNVMEMEEVIISLDSPQSLVPVRSYLRDHTTCLFKQVVEMAAVDFPGRRYGNRFDVVYCMLSRSYNARVKVVIRTGEFGTVPSIIGLFSGAGWLEREVYDRHGIFFEGNSDLRRILTDYGFQGHPLRKDFPLTGYYEVRYDELQKRVLYEPVETSQEFREFSFNNPWRSFGDDLQCEVTGGEGNGVKTVSAVRPELCDAIREINSNRNAVQEVIRVKSKEYDKTSYKDRRNSSIGRAPVL